MADLLAAGPPRFELTTNFVTVEGSDAAGVWERRSVGRDELVAVLRQLAKYGTQAAIGEFFLLHLGI